jgi:hypothetical protein
MWHKYSNGTVGGEANLHPSQGIKNNSTVILQAGQFILEIIPTRYTDFSDSFLE